MKIPDSATFITNPTMPLEYPSGPVPLDSAFYIERPPIETQVYNAIHQPGVVIRLKAPRRMGKSSLLNRIIAYATNQNFYTAVVDINQADDEVCENLDKFLRWFCLNISRQLQIPSLLDEYWDEDIGSKISCTLYFQGYILEQIDAPIVIALKETNRLFEYPHLARDFLPLLRSWHEEARQIVTWQKLRLLVVYSTELYIPLNINQSPFNVGIPIYLPSFNEEQIQDLAQRYHLHWQGKQQAEQLIHTLGGHPYLVRLALYHLVQNPKLSLEQLLKTAATSTGIYAHHLREIWEIIKQKTHLCNLLKTLVQTQDDVRLDLIAAYQLEGMGLIKVSGYKAQLSCELYRAFFQEVLLGQPQTLIELEIEYSDQELKKLVHFDELTELYNRRYFNYFLKKQWNNLLEIGSNFSLILCDIDCFKAYNDTYGHLAGDECLKQVAKAIQRCVKNPLNVVARYGGEEFAVILPNNSASDAIQLAELIRETIYNLNITHPNSNLSSGRVTVSAGGCSLIPTANTDQQTLISNADQALYQSKKGGRNQVTWIDLTQPSSVQKLGRVR